MSENTEDKRIEITDEMDVDEMILAFRFNCELASKKPFDNRLERKHIGNHDRVGYVSNNLGMNRQTT